MADQSPTKKLAVVALLSESAEGLVTLETAAHDRFCMEVEQVVKACMTHQLGMSFSRQLQDLQERLAQWVAEHLQKLNGAYITFREGGQLLFVAVQASVARDAELAASLTDLDIEIASSQRFNELNLEVLSLPKTSRAALDAFLSSGRVLAHAGNPHTPESSKRESQGA
jgi:hypothetical protein